jgi:hypothetical protein
VSLHQFAVQAWDKAEEQLREGLAQNADVTPGLPFIWLITPCFTPLAPSFCKRGGTAPKKHGSVITQFGLVARDRGVEFRRIGENLKKGQARRVRADYSETVRITAEDARDALNKAAEFLDRCALEFGFPHRDLNKDV